MRKWIIRLAEVEDDSGTSVDFEVYGPMENYLDKELFVHYVAKMHHHLLGYGPSKQVETKE